MEAISNLKIENQGAFSGKTVVALGMFDGVHTGHRALIETAVNLAEARGLEPVVFTFSNHPQQLLGKTVKRLCTNEARAKLIKELGVKRILEIPFTDEIKETLPEAFLNMLIEAVSPQLIAAGFNYTFGKNRLGTAETLKSSAAEHGICAYIIPPVIIDGEPVSSTRIKRLLQEGKIEEANIQLGRTFSLTGKILPGKKLGRFMDFPTANISPDPALILPLEGVYITRAEAEGFAYPAVTNVGSSPTVGGTELKIETNIIGFDGDIYGKELTVSFIKRLRPVIKFNSTDELKAQLAKDAAKAKEYLNDCR